MYYIFSGKFEFWTLFVLIYAVIAIIVVILERKRPEKTISWLLVFAVFPLIGFAVYLFFGRNWKKSKLTSDIDLESSLTVTEEEIRRLEKVLGNVSDEYIQLINLLERTSRSPLYFGNDVTIFKDGKEKFRSFFQEIENAKETIHLEYYLVKGDATGKKLKDLLIKKANEGVKVKFIIDKIGARLRKSYIKDLEEAGVELALYTYFLSPLLKFINTQVNYRNHRKIAIIDGQIAYIGGLNIGDEYLGKGRLGYWRDVHLKIEGQAVNGLQKVFLEDFRKIKSINGKKEFNLDTNKYYKNHEEKGDAILQIAVSGPESETPSIMQMIHKMITTAKDHIYISTPYFIPPESIMTALKIAALSGVKIKILFPGKLDHFMVYFASRTYLAELIKDNVDIYFYKKDRFTHSKFITIDSKISTVGSANIDIRSFDLNYEANVLIYDKEKTKELENIFLEDLKISTKLPQNYFEKIPWITKFTESFCRLFSNLL